MYASPDGRWEADDGSQGFVLVGVAVRLDVSRDVRMVGTCVSDLVSHSQETVTLTLLSGSAGALCAIYAMVVGVNSVTQLR